ADKGSYIAASVSRAGYSGWIISPAAGKVPGEASPTSPKAGGDSGGNGDTDGPGGGGSTGKDAEESAQLEGAAYIDGSPVVGRTLRANTDSISGTGEIAYTWMRAEDEEETGTPISGATGASYIVSTSDGGKYLAVVVTRAGKEGSIETPAVWIRKPSMKQEVLLDGDAIVYKTLRANTDGITGGGNFSYVWKRGDKPEAISAEIAGATGAAYRLAPEDWGKYITVTVSAPEFSGTITSPPAGKVADIMDKWTAVGNSGFGNLLIRDVVYGDGTAGPRFVAGGDQGKMAWSGDGITWTPVTDSGFGTNAIRKFVMGKKPDGKTLFVAGGQGGRISVSEDGVTWKAAKSALTDWITAIAWGEINGTNLFIASQFNGDMASSPDGVNWTHINGLYGQIWNWNGVIDACLVYGNPKGTGTFLGGGVNGSHDRGKIWRFATGSFGWSSVYSVPYSDHGGNFYFESSIVAAAWGEINGEGVFVMAGRDWSHDRWSGLSISSNEPSKPLVVYSKDGINWTRTNNTAFPVSSSSSLWASQEDSSDVCYTAYGKVAGIGRFINVDRINGRIAYSLNAADWRMVAGTGMPAGNSSIQAITAGSPSAGVDVFVAAGANGKMSYTKFTAD
ncbi:MAG: hypothetical protein LBC72_02310, partial [Spirochaetaceae bacterium]|nr:hypothetical protein [Spirochaetaceae bacterium]